MKLNNVLTSYMTIFSILMLIFAESQAASAAIPRHRGNQPQRAQQLNLDSGSDSDSEQDSDSESANQPVVSLNIDPQIKQSIVEGFANVNEGLNKNAQQISNIGTQVNQNLAALNPDRVFQNATNVAICTICLVAGLYFSAQDRKIRAPLIATLPNMRFSELLRYYWHFEIFCPRNFLYLMSWAAYRDIKKIAPVSARPAVAQAAAPARARTRA